MSRLKTVGILAGLGAAGVAIARHLHRPGTGRELPGGRLVGDAGAYERMSRRMLGSLFEGIAADVAAVAPKGARVLEVGCGPGHLSVRMAQGHGLEVTGVDLDPEMIVRAGANAAGARGEDDRAPTFLVADVASLRFEDETFDLVVSTMSMHHWADPGAGLAEIARVLRPGGRTLIWDLRRGIPIHREVPDPVEQVHDSALQVISAAPWRWPWRLALIQRIELARPDPGPTAA